MNTKEAEEKLKDYLLNGTQAELFWAKEAREAAVVIGKHSQRINSTRFSPLFGRLQEIFSERETLSVAKIFDRPSRRNPVRSILTVLILIESNAALWSLPERGYLENLLVESGYSSFEEKNNEQVSLDVVDFFKQSMPSVEKKENCQLSRALDCVFQSRDKVHAHNEAIPKTERNLPSWADTEILINYAEEFVKTISVGFFGWAEVITRPEMMSKQLELVMGALNLVNEDYLKNERNFWVIERLRKELFKDN